MTPAVEQRAGKRPLQLAMASVIARSFASLIAPACARVEIAGSIRRMRPEVGDIEIIAQPVYRLETFTPAGELGVQIDLFILTPPAEWGPALVIRTGPADFSREMVTQLRRRDMRCENLRIETIEGEHVPCPDEETFFELCGYRYLEPQRRY